MRCQIAICISPQIARLALPPACCSRTRAATPAGRNQRWMAGFQRIDNTAPCDGVGGALRPCPRDIICHSRRCPPRRQNDPERAKANRNPAVQQPLPSDVCYPFGGKHGRHRAVKRREFIVVLGGAAAAWPLGARAQQPPYGVGQRRKTHRIAVISPAAPIALMTETSPNLFFREFFVELRRLGYVEGETLVVHRFSSEGHAQRNAEVVTAAIRASPDVIFAFSCRIVKLLKDATTAIPIVGYTADPISFGIVTSLARPGGNVTGISTEAG